MIINFSSIQRDYYGNIEEPVVTLKTPHGAVISTIPANSINMTCRYNDDFARRVVVRLNQTAKSHHGSCCDGCKGFGVFVEKFMKVLLSQKNVSTSNAGAYVLCRTYRSLLTFTPLSV